MKDEQRAASGKSSDELLGQLAEELSVLVRSDLELAVAERGPQLRRLGVEFAVALPAAIAVFLAFAALGWAGGQGLAQVMPSWCASLVVAAFWALAAALLLRLDHPRRLLRRLSTETSGEAVGRATRDRSEAEQAVKATAERLGRAVAREVDERELHAPIDGAERLMGTAEHEGEDLLKEIVVALLAPGKAGLSLLEVMIGRRSGRDGS
jgi:hypothetical protein